ncbi:fibronectin type III domain-containing protein [Microscilla marina]|uniref:fibronectin type III domain-containing protein n=1 Tax=Microscilla marina TaxID=1027 RepID=UPI0009490B17|nr:fibronectin type III domain-containing protein [Microscilla marina]
MRIHLFKCLIIAGVLLLGASGYTTAQQNYSVKIIATVARPVSPYLSNFGYNHSLQLTMVLNGLTSYAGYLRIKLESIDGRGIVIQTRDSYRPLLDLGPSQTLSGSELSDYFSANNLSFSGYSRQQYLKTKRVPDGIYRISFSFVDRFRTNVLVSNVDILSQKTLRVFALQPVIVNTPIHFSTLNSQNSGNVPISINWARPANTPFNPEYELILNELRPNCQNQYANINANNPTASRISQGEIFNCLGPEIFRATTTSLAYNYGMQAEPVLGLGKWYAIRIQARDPQGRTLFINDGVSQIRVFRYGKPCPVPARLQAKALNPYQVQLDWDAQNDHTGYTVHFKREGDAYKWHTKRALSNRVQINDMEPGVSYSFKLTADCNAFGSEETATVDFRMPTPKPTGVQCGKPLVVDLSNQRPISGLRVGDKIMAADFEFTLVEVKPLGGGWFAGRAYTHIKFFQGARVFARFDRIKINTDKRLIDGELTTDGAGTQIIPDEWRDQYLSFMGEINNLFDEIERGLDKLDQVVGKIDQVLKKVEQWVKNYNGPDKTELLETIQIGKKTIEDGKKDWKDGKITEATKKLKDGGGKILKVAGKLAKEALERLWQELSDLFRKIVQAIKGDDDARQKQLSGQMDSLSVTIDREVARLSPTIAPENAPTPQADSTAWLVVNTNVASATSQYPVTKVYLEARQKYAVVNVQHGQKKIRLVLLVELLQKADKMALVVKQIKDKATNIVEEYSRLKKAGKNELEIINGLKELVAQFINQAVVTPFLEENGLKK